NSVDTLLSRATFYIKLGQPKSALPGLGRILSSAPEYADSVFNDLDISKLDFDQIVANGGMPARLEIVAPYFRHLMDAGDLGNARKAWTWIRSLSPDDRLAQTYIHFLFEHKLPEEAALAWASQLGDREPGSGRKSFIVNGGFERELQSPLF